MACQGQDTLLSRMNSVPRILGMGLLVVLASLAALLGASAWNAPHPSPKSPGSTIVAGSAADAAAPSNPTRLSAITTRMALALALTAFAVAVMLVFSLTLRAP